MENRTMAEPTGGTLKAFKDFWSAPKENQEAILQDIYNDYLYAKRDSDDYYALDSDRYRSFEAAEAVLAVFAPKNMRSEAVDQMFKVWDHCGFFNDLKSEEDLEEKYSDRLIGKLGDELTWLRLYCEAIDISELEEKIGFIYGCLNTINESFTLEFSLRRNLIKETENPNPAELEMIDIMERGFQLYYTIAYIKLSKIHKIFAEREGLTEERLIKVQEDNFSEELTPEPENYPLGQSLFQIYEMYDGLSDGEKKDFQNNMFEMYKLSKKNCESNFSDDEDKDTMFQICEAAIATYSKKFISLAIKEMTDILSEREYFDDLERIEDLGKLYGNRLIGSLGTDLDWLWVNSKVLELEVLSEKLELASKCLNSIDRSYRNYIAYARKEVKKVCGEDSGELEALDSEEQYLYFYYKVALDKLSDIDFILKERIKNEGVPEKKKPAEKPSVKAKEKSIEEPVPSTKTEDKYIEDMPSELENYPLGKSIVELFDNYCNSNDDDREAFHKNLYSMYLLARENYSSKFATEEEGNTLFEICELALSVYVPAEFRAISITTLAVILCERHYFENLTSIDDLRKLYNDRLIGSIVPELEYLEKNARTMDYDELHKKSTMIYDFLRSVDASYKYFFEYRRDLIKKEGEHEPGELEFMDTQEKYLTFYFAVFAQRFRDIEAIRNERREQDEAKKSKKSAKKSPSKAKEKTAKKSEEKPDEKSSAKAKEKPKAEPKEEIKNPEPKAVEATPAKKEVTASSDVKEVKIGTPLEILKKQNSLSGEKYLKLKDGAYNNLRNAFHSFLGKISCEVSPEKIDMGALMDNAECYMLLFRAPEEDDLAVNALMEFCNLIRKNHLEGILSSSVSAADSKVKKAEKEAKKSFLSKMFSGSDKKALIADAEKEVELLENYVKICKNYVCDYQGGAKPKETSAVRSYYSYAEKQVKELKKRLSKIK